MAIKDKKVKADSKPKKEKKAAAPKADKKAAKAPAPAVPISSKEILKKAKKAAKKVHIRLWAFFLYYVY